MAINKVILVGNVGKDPVIRYFDKGVAKATFPLATSETYRNQKGERVTNTEWHNIVLWRSLAEVAEKSVKKGTQLYISGKIKTRSYIDKDGNNKYITEILADTMFVLDRKQGTSISNEANDSIQENEGYKPLENGNHSSYYNSSGKKPDTFNEPDKMNYPFDEEPIQPMPEDDLPF